MRASKLVACTAAQKPPHVVIRKKGKKFFFFEKSKQKTIVCLVGVVAGCSSAEPAYYSLQAVPGVVRAAQGGSVEVVRPGIAGYLDRSGIVLRQSDFKLQVAIGARWGEPLADMIGRVLAQDLSQRMPGANVFSGDGAISADAAMRVEVNVQKFDAEADGSVRLVADLAIERSHQPIAAHAVSLQTSAVGAEPGGLASAMSALLGQLADQAVSGLPQR